ncbi:META domain-containing protein [Vibrio sp. JC009]|uniref:META domain-containing protein n=1 Tax=Vibrio sp. JC009 TaxID=2912314 RepID=UPI0023AF6641|nr:META domain-containing protein [Vibrio sp. JC009]WED22918.1 META domain-containing protein [Vibrio sp. JC009]
MKKLIATLSLPLILGACQSTDEQVANVTETALVHHNWTLVRIDGENVQTGKNKPVANLEIGEKMSATGNAGCNNFFGQGELRNNQFRIKAMGMTMKMCKSEFMTMESVVAPVLGEWSDMSLTEETLVLKSSEHTLTFVLTDWK